MSTTILLADDHHLMREGLRSIIEGELHMDVVGQAGDGVEAVELARSLRPDVVVMDVHMPTLNGVDATREIKSDAVAPRVIALSMNTDARIVTEMLRAGADGYLLKQCVLDEFADAVSTVLNGRKYLGSDLADLVIGDYLRHLDAEAIAEETTLSTRERQILQLLAEGYSSKEIAGLLCISSSTVDTHRQHVMEKLRERSVAGLTRAAIRMGLLPA